MMIWRPRADSSVIGARYEEHQDGFNHEGHEEHEGLEHKEK